MTTETTITYSYEFVDDCGRHVGKKSIPASLATFGDFRLALLAGTRDWLKWHAGAWVANLPGYDFVSLCEAIKDGDDWSSWVDQLAGKAARTICSDLESNHTLAGAFADDWFAALRHDDDARKAAHYYSIAGYCSADAAFENPESLTYDDDACFALADLAGSVTDDSDDIAADIRLATADAIRNSWAVKRFLGC